MQIIVWFNADEHEDYYDSNYNSKMKLSIISLSYIGAQSDLYNLDKSKSI